MVDLVERLRDAAMGDHKRNCAGRAYLCECGYDAANQITCQEAARALEAADALAEAARQALEGVQCAFPSYRTRNGKSVSIQADDGEKCWIIHDDVRNDAINALAALAAYREARRG